MARVIIGDILKKKKNLKVKIIGRFILPHLLDREKIRSLITLIRK